MSASLDFDKQGQNFLSPDGATWRERVIKADDVWAQVSGLLADAKVELPKTPRRPDVRLIIENISGQEIQFYNPGDHSRSKAEIIPASGTDRAVMVMPAGITLDEQKVNASVLYINYDLGNLGLSARFMADLKNGSLTQENNRLINEAYGPAPFAGQVSKLTPVEWVHADQRTTSIVVPELGLCAAFGARAAVNEMALLSEFPIFVKGSSTTPELVESQGMVIAVSQDWQSGAISTRPIVPSVAKEFYGLAYKNIPVVTLTPEGLVVQLDLKNGTVLTADLPTSMPKTTPLKADIIRPS